VKFLHHTKRLQNTGGMGTIIHHARGSANMVSFREPDSPGVTGLGITDGQSIRQLRRAYAARVPTAACSLYHNGWGLELVADLDPARQRVLLLHTDLPDLAGWLQRIGHWADAIFTVNQALAAKIRSLLPGAVVTYIPTPCVPPPEIAAARQQPRPHPIIGFCGRLTIKQKRIDRLPTFWRLLRAAIPTATLEIMGTGPDEPWLRQALGEDGRVRFLGWREGAAYWAQLGSWQQIIFLSDWEGTPITLLEAVTAGAAPIYPDFYHDQDFPAQYGPGHLYPPGDVPAAVAAARAIAQWDQARWETFWQRSHAGLQPHWNSRYVAALESAVAALPAPTGWRKRPGWWTRQMPVLIYNRRWVRWTGGA